MVSLWWRGWGAGGIVNNRVNGSLSWCINCMIYELYIRSVI